MARGTNDFGNGLGYIYQTERTGAPPVITAVYKNDVAGLRNARHNAGGNAPIASKRTAYSIEQILSCASIGQITSYNVAGVNQIGGPLNVATNTPSVLAAQIALAISSFTPPTGPNYGAVSQGDLVIVFEPLKSAGQSNGILPTMAVTSGTITFTIDAFVNGAVPSGSFDASYGERYWLDADYGPNGIPGSTPAVPTSIQYALEVTDYITLRGTESGFPVLYETISGDRLVFATAKRIAQEELVYVMPEAGASDFCAYLNPELFIEGDKLMLRSLTIANTVVFVDARTSGSYSPEQFPNIYLNNTETWQTKGNDETLTLQFHYDEILGPIFIEIARSISSTCITVVTKVQADALIAANALKTGCKYMISDRADLGIILAAAAPNKFEMHAEGRFLNADFGFTGDFSGLPGFTGQLGVWKSTLVMTGNVAIWGNVMYFAINGIVGSQPDTDAANWSAIAKSVTTGYTLVVDKIEYDYSNDWIQSRADNNGNVVSLSYQKSILIGVNTLNTFQWGNVSVHGNIVKEGVCDLSGNLSNFYDNNILPGGKFIFAESLIPIYSNIIEGEISGNLSPGGFGIGRNYVASGCLITDNVLGNGQRLADNFLTGGSSIDGNIFENTFSISGIIGSTLNNANITGGTIKQGAWFLNCQIHSSKIQSFLLDIGAQITAVISMIDITGRLHTDTTGFGFPILHRVESGFSNFPTPHAQDIDITGAAILDYLADNNYVGDPVISSANPAENINSIVNPPTNHRFRLRPISGLVLTITMTAIGAAVAGRMVSGVASRVLKGTNNDYIEFENIGGILYETEVRISI